MLLIYRTQLAEKKQLAVDVFLFKFQLTDPKEINFTAGQYLMLKVNDKSRLYSIASPDFQKDSFELLVQIIPGGLASTYLSNLKIGDEVIFQGPAGMFTLRESPRPKVFLATGTGMAPMRAIIKSKQFTNLTKPINLPIPDYFLFWGLKTYKDVYLFEELKEIKKLSNQVIKEEKNPNFSHFDFKICLSREKNLEIVPEEDRQYFALGHVDEVLEKMFQVSRFTFHDFDFYLCGSPDVVESLRKYLEEKGVPKDQVFFEKF